MNTFTRQYYQHKGRRQYALNAVHAPQRSMRPGTFAPVELSLPFGKIWRHAQAGFVLFSVFTDRPAMENLNAHYAARKALKASGIKFWEIDEAWHAEDQEMTTLHIFVPLGAAPGIVPSPEKREPESIIQAVSACVFTLETSDKKILVQLADGTAFWFDTNMAKEPAGHALHEKTAEHVFSKLKEVPYEQQQAARREVRIVNAGQKVPGIWTQAGMMTWIGSEWVQRDEDDIPES